MKKLLWGLVIALIGWNSILTYSMVTSTEPEPEETVSSEEGGITYINNTINGYTTDITKTVEAAQTGIVSVTTTNIMDGGQVKASGIIYRSNGRDCYIVTSASIISENCLVKVEFDNGVGVDGELIGTDFYTDLAVVRVQPDFECVALTAGNETTITQGEYVVEMSGRDASVGNAVVAFGVVSTPLMVYREGNEQRMSAMLSLIVSDVNSVDSALGGPLLNLDGEYIGIVTRRILLPESYRRLTPAVAVGEVQLVADQLIETGRTERAYLGIVGRNVSDMQLYEKSGAGIMLDVTEGIYITDVLENSPAELAGLMVGDVLTSINKISITDTTALRSYLYLGIPNVPIQLTINRSGTIITAEAMMGTPTVNEEEEPEVEEESE